MILEIDTTVRENFYLSLMDENIEKCFKLETENQADDILPAIDDILKKNQLTLSDLKKIFVNLGPGSFTGVRVGVTVANTLAWTLNIPVYGYKEGERDKILNKITKNNKLHFQTIVLPYYLK